MVSDDDLMSPAEAASAFGVTAKTISRWADTGKLPFVTTPGGHRRFVRSDVVAARAAAGPRRAPRPAERKTEFLSASLTRPARDELRQFALSISPAVRRQVSLSEALIAALGVADENREAVVKRLTRDTT